MARSLTVLVSYALALVACSWCVSGAAAGSPHEVPPALQAEPPVPVLIERAEAAGLASDPQWLALGRWRGGVGALGTSSGRSSNVLDEEFFLAAAGRTDPVAELRATIHALAAPLPAAGDEHAVCRFPARALFLRRHLGWPARPPASLCPALREWTGNGSITGVSLLFATAYFGNAGSVYGHVLIKFRSAATDAGGAALLDRTVNYGAAESEQDGMPAYIFKGLTGRYRSQYTPLEFYQHTQRYREIELRDLWEYRLNLTPYEVDLIAGNLWELLGRKNRYYFLLQNCAYRVGELLEVVSADAVVPTNKLWATPMDVLQRLTSGTSSEGHPLIRDVELHRSRFSAYRDGFQALSPPARQFVRARIQADAHAGHALPSSAGLSETELAAALDVLIDYRAYSVRREEDASAEKERLDALLLERLALPARTRPPTVPREPPPHLARRPSRLAVGAVHDFRYGNGLQIELRPANHTFVTPQTGILPDSELMMGAVTVRLRDDDLALTRLDIVRLTSLNATSRSLPGVAGRAWRFRAGAERLRHDPDEDSVGLIEGGWGRAAGAGPITLYGLATGRFNAPAGRSRLAEAGLTAGIVVQGRGWSAHLESVALAPVTDGGGIRAVHAFQARLGGSRRWDLRLRAEYRDTMQAGVTFARYW